MPPLVPNEIPALIAKSLLPIPLQSDVIANGLVGAAALNGVKGVIVDLPSHPITPESRYQVHFTGKDKPLAVKQQNLILFTVPDAQGPGCHPTAFDVILSSPTLSIMDAGLELSLNLIQFSAPLSLHDFNTVLGQDEDDYSLSIMGTPYDEVEEADSRLVYFYLDAIGHYLIIEWRQDLNGWRLIQSHVKDKDEKGYTAIEWCSPHANNVGSNDGGIAHYKWGRGKILSDFDISELSTLLISIQKLCDTIVLLVLLPQVPFFAAPAFSKCIDPHASESDKKKWLGEASRLGTWANGKLKETESTGMKTTKTLETLTITTSTPRTPLLTIPRFYHDKLSEAFCCLTGEDINPGVYIKMLQYVGYKDGIKGKSEDGRSDQFVGFGVKGISWSS